MKQFGLVSTRELISIPLDDAGNPRLETLAPTPTPDDWTPPAVVPLVKLEQPSHDPATHRCEAVLVWYEDRVERDWQITAKIATPDEIYNTARSNLAAYWASQPAWIRGPFESSYQSAVSLLNRHDINAAIAIIDYAPIPSGYDEDQLAAFDSVRGILLAGLKSLAAVELNE